MTNSAPASTDVQSIPVAEIEARALTLFLPCLIAYAGVPGDVLEEMARSCSAMQAQHIHAGADERTRRLECLSADLAAKLLREAVEARRSIVLAATPTASAH